MTAATEVRLERWLGRAVYDSEGRRVGRLEEVIAEREEDGWFVTSCHIGTAALFERLSAHILKLPRSWNRGFIASWEQMDWSRPERPRLLCPRRELRAFRRPVARDRTGG